MTVRQIRVGRLGSRVDCLLCRDLSGICESHRAHPALIVLPGGGYNHISPREGEPVALRFLSHAVNCFILHYPVGKDIRKESPLETLSALVDEIHDRAEDYGVDRTRMAVIGFSAGGHLAASYGTIRKGLHLSAMILGYPVITSGTWAHQASFDMLCRTQEERQEYSIETRVDQSTLPSFIFTSADDRTVSVENSLLMASALSQNGVPFELHIFPSAVHGSSVGTGEVGTRNPDFARWFPLALDWLFKIWRYEE